LRVHSTIALFTAVSPNDALEADHGTVSKPSQAKARERRGGWLTFGVLSDVSLRVHQHVVAVALEAVGVVGSDEGVHPLEVEEAAGQQTIDQLPCEGFG
jgi:hypothetical protein